MTQNADSTTPATGTYTTNGIPHSFTTITPFVVIERLREALDFYQDVFGATVRGVTEQGGRIVHAEVDFGQGRVQFGEPSPDYHLVAGPDGEDDCFSLGLYCPDVDAVVAAAEEAGATVREPLMTFVSGDRFASIRDPFGLRWSVMTRVEDLSDAESERRVAEWAAAQSSGESDE